MLELIDELRSRDFTVCIVTGGGTEFVRAVSQDLYGVPPEAVVGTLIGYEYSRDDDGAPAAAPHREIAGGANEGAAKVANIQAQLGRRPILAAGNSGGDREMLEWAAAGDGPTLALLVDHDDAEREFSYVSTAETFAEPEPITRRRRPPRLDRHQHGRRLGDDLPPARLDGLVAPAHREDLERRREGDAEALPGLPRRSPRGTRAGPSSPSRGPSMYAACASSDATPASKVSVVSTPCVDRGRAGRPHRAGTPPHGSSPSASCSGKTQRLPASRTASSTALPDRDVVGLVEVAAAPACRGSCR